jgi:hypothetical protein
MYTHVNTSPLTAGRDVKNRCMVHNQLCRRVRRTISDRMQRALLDIVCACFLLSLLSLGRPENLCVMESIGTRVRLRGTVLNVGGNPKPEVVPPGSKLRAALFIGECAVGHVLPLRQDTRSLS